MASSSALSHCAAKRFERCRTSVDLIPRLPCVLRSEGYIARRAKHLDERWLPISFRCHICNISQRR